MSDHMTEYVIPLFAFAVVVLSMVAAHIVFTQSRNKRK